MIKARDIMTPDPVTATPDMELIQAADLLLRNHFNGLPVVSAEGAIVGILFQSDLVSQQKKVHLPSIFTIFDGFIPLGSFENFEKELKRIAATTVGEAMTEKPVTVSPDTPVDVIATLMVERNIHTLPVVDGPRVVGIIGKEDILKHMVKQSTSGS